MNVQEFLGSIKVDGDVVSDGNVTAKNMSSGGNLSVINVVANGQISADALRIGTPNRVFAGERDLNVTVGAGTIIFIGCSGTVNTTGTGAKTMYLIGCPALTVNNNGYAKTYRDGYAVGGILQTTGADSPAEAFGGNWERYSEGRVLVGLNPADTSFNAVGKTGGSKDAVVVSHTHELESLPNTGTGGILPDGRTVQRGYSSTNATVTPIVEVKSSGVSGADKNLPPYIVVNMWRRINVSGQE